MKKVVNNRQSILDCLIQYFGSIDSLFTLTGLNNLSITDDLLPGTEIEIGTPKTNSVIQTYLTKNIIPATIIIEGQTVLPGGIDYMAVGIDFIIS